MSPKILPARPDIEQYKKQAKDLVHASRHAAPEAEVRIRQFHPRLGNFNTRADSLKLSDAQLIIAREHAFESWPRFAKHVEALQLAQPMNEPKHYGARIRFEGIGLPAEVAVPNEATGVVLIAHASGSSRHNPRNRYVADLLHHGSLCTVVTDLLTEEEELNDIDTEALRFDFRLLGDRIAATTDWIVRHPLLQGRKLGYFGSGDSAAPMLFAAAEHPNLVQAVVSSGGRPDLVGPWLGRVQAPTLFVVGGKDSLALGFNHSALTPLPPQTVRKLEVISGASQSFEEPGALDRSATLARDWFRQYLTA